MGKPIKFDEYDFLDLFYQDMLKKGHSHNLIRLSVNARFVEQVYESSGQSLTEDQLKKIADICLANGWVEHATMGGLHNNLRLTTTGFGVVKSKRMRAEQMSNRGIMGKASDFVVDHKGLFILFGFVIALASLLIKLYGSSGNG